MLFKKNSINFRNESFLTNKTKTKIVTRAINLNIFRENVFKTNIKINLHYITITTKLLRQQKSSLRTIIDVYRERHIMMTVVTFI